MAKRLNPMDRARIRAASGCAEQTIDRFVVDPRSVRCVSGERITRAARELGITLPPPPPHAV
jgi:hypothetical protein